MIVLPLRGVLTAAFVCCCATALVSCSKPAANKCTSNSQCSSGEVCSGGKCVEPVMPQCGDQTVCQQNSDCPSRQCASDGCCYGLCTSDSDCTSSQQCVVGVCRDIGEQCTINADCPYMDAPICDPTLGACVQCLPMSGPQNNECPSGEYCSDDTCVMPPSGTCTTSSDCTVPQLSYCETTSGQCVACLTDANCNSADGGTGGADGGMPDTCTNGVCEAHTSGCLFDGDCVGNAHGAYCDAAGQCVPCLANADCPSGNLCQANHTCSAATTCATDSDCSGSTPHCSPSDHFCVECVENEQCPTGQVCKSGYCEPPVNGCLTSADCTAPLGTCDTSDRTCVGCLSDSDCPAFCESETCEPCSTDSDCLTNPGTLEAGRLLCEGGACVQCIGTPNCSGTDICNNAGMCVPNPVNMPCPVSGDCGQGLDCVQDGTSTGTCREQCDPYDPSCDDGLVCGIIGGETSGVPSAACQPSIPNSAALGQSCATKPCDRDGICLPNGSGEECYPRCDPNQSSASCSGANMCATVVELDPNDVPFSEGVCIPESTFTESCGSSASCDSGQDCVAEGNPSNPATLTNVCWYPIGSGGAGAGCSENANCQSGRCIFDMPQDQQFNGFCDGACTSSASCPVLRSDSYAGGCGSVPTSWYDANGNTESTPVTTCFTQCRSSTECPTGTVCDITPDIDGNAWLARCVPASSSGTGLGGSVCYSDSDCVSNDCIPLTAADIGVDGSATQGGICAGVCNPSAGTVTNAACASGATCPAGGQDIDIGQNNYHPAPICWTQACTTNTQCGPAGTCTGFPAANNEISLGCIPTQGTVAGGGTCSEDSDCESGWCVTWSGGSRCFGTCSSQNCAGGGYCYIDQPFNGSSNSISYCGPPAN